MKAILYILSILFSVLMLIVFIDISKGLMNHYEHSYLLGLVCTKFNLFWVFILLSSSCLTVYLLGNDDSWN